MSAQPAPGRAPHNCNTIHRRIESALSAALVMVLAQSRAMADDRAHAPAWTVTDCAGAPSHVLYDPESELLYVSQISGEGDAKDGDGVISQLTLDGRVTQCSWFAGLHAPKGLALQDRTIWVTDIDELVAIRIDGARLLSRWPLRDAKFLVGAAAGSDGAIYACDLLGSALFRLRDGRCETFASGPQWQSPTAVCAESDRLRLATWGLTSDYTTETPGSCLSVDLKSRALSALDGGPTGNLYGLAVDGSGGLFTSDFSSGRVMHVSDAGATEVLQRPAGVAGLAYVPEAELLVVAELTENRITAFRIPLEAPRKVQE